MKRQAQIIVMTMILGVALAGWANLLSNPGFETGDLSQWTAGGGGWRTGTGGDAYSGTYGAVCDVLTNDAAEWRILEQFVFITAGQEYDASCWLRSINLEDPSASASWLEIQWIDDTGATMWGSGFQSTQVSNDQVYTQMIISGALAPVGAVTASVRGVVQMYGGTPPSDPDFHTFDDFSFTETIPEPGVLALLGVGVGMAAILRKRLTH